MSLQLISQIYDPASDDDGEHGSGGDTKDIDHKLEVLSSIPKSGINNKLELNVKNHKLIRNPSSRKRTRADHHNLPGSKKDIAYLQPKKESSDKQAKPSKRKRAKQSEPIQRLEKDVDDGGTVPDLTKQLPFTHCKIVFRLEADYDDGDTQMPQVGWERQGKQFIFNDLITHQEMERLERYARKRELASRPCSKSKQGCTPGRMGMRMSPSSKSKPESAQGRDNTEREKVTPSLRNSTLSHQLSRRMKLSPELDSSNNTIIASVNSKSDVVNLNIPSRVPAPASPIISESEMMEDAKVTGNKVPLPLIFRCPFCLQTFNEARGLLKHLPLHTGKNLKWNGPEAVPHSNANANLLKQRTLEPLINEECEGPEKLNEELKTERCEKIPKEKCCKLVLNRCDSLLEQYGLSLRGSQFVEKAYHPTDPNMDGIGTSSTTTNEGKGDVGINENIEIIQSNGQRNSRGSYKCKLCEKLFAQRSGVVYHIRSVHNQEKRFKCANCQKAFFNSRDFKCHQLTHSGLKPNKCHLCPQAFSHRSSLWRHLLTHNGIKPYKCNHCYNTFSERGNLKRHLLTHSGIKPHKCNLCHKTFSQRCHLNRHLLTHLITE